MEMNCIPGTLVTGWTTVSLKRYDLSRGADVFIPVKKAFFVVCFIPFHSTRIYIMQLKEDFGGLKQLCTFSPFMASCR